MPEDHLGQLPHDGDGPADAVVADDQGLEFKLIFLSFLKVGCKYKEIHLHSPPPVVAEGEPVKVAPQPLPGHVPAVNAILLLGVDTGGEKKTQQNNSNKVL